MPSLAVRVGHRGEPSSTGPGARALALAAAGLAAAIVVFAGYSLLYLLSAEVVPVDFHVYRDAAEDIAAGRSPYPWFAYPPLSALGAVPFTPLSVAAADFLVKALLVLGVFAVLAVAGVRDWRCYPLALLWAPVSAAVQTGNITIPLALAAALAWRFRDRPFRSGLALGTSVAAKLFLWPLWVWFASAGRRAAALWSVVAGAAVGLASWAVVDLAALPGYPERLRSLDQATSGAGYTVDAVAADLGLGTTAGRVLFSALAVSLLVAVAVAGRRGSEARCFVLATAAALACSPIVWLHYFALLLVPVAIASPRLGPLWFVPLAMWGFGAGTGNGSTLDTTVVLVVAAATLALAARAAGGSRTGASAPVRPATTQAAAAGRP